MKKICKAIEQHREDLEEILIEISKGPIGVQKELKKIGSTINIYKGFVDMYKEKMETKKITLEQKIEFESYYKKYKAKLDDAKVEYLEVSVEGSIDISEYVKATRTAKILGYESLEGDAYILFFEKVVYKPKTEEIVLYPFIFLNKLLGLNEEIHISLT